MSRLSDGLDLDDDVDVDRDRCGEEDVWSCSMAASLEVDGLDDEGCV
jgi:hypothetical protein